MQIPASVDTVVINALINLNFRPAQIHQVYY